MPISALSAEEVWDGTFPAADENAAYSGGSGLQEDPYLISTAEDLAQLSVNTNEIPDYTVDKYFKQTADIILNSPDVFARDEKGYITGIAEGKTANAWTPIGNHFYLQILFAATMTERVMRFAVYISKQKLIIRVCSVISIMAQYHALELKIHLFSAGAGSAA